MLHNMLHIYQKGKSMTIKDFATEHDISVSTINAYIRRHAQDFDGHLTLGSDGKTRILDDTAIALLNKKYPQSTTAVQVITPDPDSNKKNALIQDLESEINALKIRNQQLEAALFEAKKFQYMLSVADEQTKKLEEQLALQQTIAAKSETKAAVAEAKLDYERQRVTEANKQVELQKKQIKEITLRAESAEDEAKEQTKRLEETEKRATAAEAEANSYVKSWFGFFRKKHV